MSGTESRDNGETISESEIRDAFYVDHASPGTNESWDDARSIRAFHGVAPFFKQLFETTDYKEIDTDESLVRDPGVIPDCLVHVRRSEREKLKQEIPDLGSVPRCRRHILRWLTVDQNARQSMSIGGTDFLATGQPGSGKSTLACDLGRLLIEINPRESVVWRGTPSRAEWTPLGPWTRLLLPESCDPVAIADEPYGPTATVDPSSVAREVVRYSTVDDAIDSIRPGAIHVIYPDPEGRGVPELFRRSERTDAWGWSDETPIKHWWFAFVAGWVDRLGSEWSSLIFDEIGDLLPQAARSGEANNYWYEKIESFRDTLVDARKKYKSLYMFGHNSADVSDLVRRKLRWRISMNGWPNPTKGDNIVGMKEPPMRTDLTTRMNIGRGLWWNALRFCKFGWNDLTTPTDAEIAIALEGDRVATPGGSRS
jgi:hypothetical protein